MGIRTKFLLAFLFLAAAVILVLNTYPVKISRDTVFISKENSIVPYTAQIGGSVELLDRMTPENVSRVMNVLETDGLSRVSIMNANLDELYSMRNNVTGYDERVIFALLHTAMGNGTDEFRSIYRDGAFMSYACVPIVSGGQVAGAVCVYEYDVTEGEIISGLREDLAKISVGLGALALVVGLVLSQTLSYRVARVLDAIGNVRKGEYTYRVRVSGHDEVAQLAEEFNSLTDRLQRTEEIRRRFVADASHELKTPLAAIRLLSDSILETDNMDADTVKEFVGGIREESERLARTTGQLLALTKLDSPANVTRSDVDCARVAERVLGTLEPIAVRDGISLDAHIAEGCHIMATSDELFQILYNLVDNAIKYNCEGGSVTLTLKRADENVEIDVADTGIGIPEEDMPHIFDRFYRVEKSRGRDQGGTGLGLPIVRSTAKRHGGDVTAESRPEGGTVFKVTFPAYSPAAEPTAS